MKIEDYKELARQSKIIPIDIAGEKEIFIEFDPNVHVSKTVHMLISIVRRLSQHMLSLSILLLIQTF